MADFKKILKIEKKTYDRFDCITSKILKPAIEEINEKTDIQVKYETIKEGRKVCALKFDVESRKDRNIIINQKEKINPRSFNNVESREYNWNVLENKLLGWDKE